MKPISIAIVEPKRLFRETMQLVLHRSPFDVIAVARAAADLFDGLRTCVPDLVIWGPGACGDAETQMPWVRERCAGLRPVRFVILADTVDAEWIRRVAASGADAVLQQDISGEMMQRSLDLIMLGQQLFPATLAFTPLTGGEKLPEADLIPLPQLRGAGRVPAAKVAPQRDVSLSGREARILRCLVNGASNKAIARELQVTETTVKAHMTGLLRKVRAANRTQAAIWALSKGAELLDEAMTAQAMRLTVADAPSLQAAG